MFQRSITALLLLLALGPGCTSDEITGGLPGNHPPKVWVAIGPPERSAVGYRVHFYWGGWDSDGDVIRYEYAITNNETGVFNPADTTGADKWHPVTVADSTFLFTADLPDDSTDLDTDNQTARDRRPHTDRSPR